MARRRRAATAARLEDEQLTYARLNRLANRLAHHLIDLGIAPDTLVAICVERSLEVVVGLLAVLKAGGAYVPLDPDFPAERLAFMLEDSAPLALLTQRSLKARWPDLPEQMAVIELDAKTNAWYKRSATNPKPHRLGLTPKHLAYLIYTSGSTGQPKGVMVEHQSAINLWTGLQHAVFFNPTRPHLRVGLNASLSFDASVKQVLALLDGHSLCIIAEQTRLDSDALVACIRRMQLDVIDCVPSQLKLLEASGLFAPSQWRPSILLLGGEPIDESSWQMLNRIDGVAVYNVYGPTECTVDATCCRLRPGMDRPHIGHPLANIRIYILDLNQQPVPIGVAGELYIGGACVARGYLNRPELTSERFLPDPYAKATEHEPDTRIYRTGDLARFFPDGNIEFLGRNDFQVKIRGYRIELGEIEARLCEIEGVKEAVVLAAQDAAFDTRLIAYCIGSEDLRAVALRSRLSGALPGYMVPAAYVHLTALPLTANGKLDRKALPAPEGDAFGTRAYEAPRGEAEQTLAAIW